MAEYSLGAEPTHSRWNRALKPRLRVASGDTVHLECVDSSGAQVHPAMTLAEYLKIDRDRIHALTGPIFVEGAEPGDVLQVDVLEVAHKGWGWTSVVSRLVSSSRSDSVQKVPSTITSSIATSTK